MITSILITIMICLTLITISLIVTNRGIDIRIKKDYRHTFTDKTVHKESPSPPQESPDDLKERLKEKEDTTYQTIVESTVDVMNSYLEPSEKKKKEENS